MEKTIEYKNRIKTAEGRLKRKTGNMMAQIIACVIMVSLCFTIAACDSSGAGSEVQHDLDALRTSTSAGSHLESLKKTVSVDTSKNIDEFLAKVRDFEYEIISEEEKDEDEGTTAIVKVRIRTYDFGSEYLAAMSEYAKNDNKENAEDADSTEFYDELFGRLSKLDSRDYVRDVDIVAYSPDGSSEWVTNIKNNEDLQDALFGGMTGEMKALSEEQ